MVKVPNTALKEVGVLMKPMSIVEKGLEQAYEVQRGPGIWQPVRSAVIGAGSLGLLAMLALRLQGLKVTVLARTEPPTLNSELARSWGLGI